MENPPKGPEDNKTIRIVLERWAPASLRSKVVAVLYSSGLTVGDVTELSTLRAALLICTIKSSQLWMMTLVNPIKSPLPNFQI